MGNFANAFNDFCIALKKDDIAKGTLDKAKAKSDLKNSFDKLVEELFNDNTKWDELDNIAYRKLKELDGE